MEEVLSKVPGDADCTVNAGLAGLGGKVYHQQLSVVSRGGRRPRSPDGPWVVNKRWFFRDGQDPLGPHQLLLSALHPSPHVAHAKTVWSSASKE